MTASWMPVADFATHDDLAQHLTEPLRIATTHEISEDHPAYDSAYAVGLATKRAQPYLVGADDAGIVTVRHPFVDWQTDLTVAEFAECFAAVVGASPPAEPPAFPNIQGLGELS